MQKDQKMDLDEAKDKLKQAGIAEDEMAALERQLAPSINNTTSGRKVAFVSAGVESQSDGAIKGSANQEDIELPDKSDSDEDDDKVEIAQKDVPDAVFGGLVRKREEDGKDGEDANKDSNGESRLGALERIKRQKQGS